MNITFVQLCFIMLALFAGLTSANAEALKMDESVAQTVNAEQLINVNTASVEQLTALPGIGASKAAAIVSYRESQGPFKSIDELVNVKGIGSKILAKLAGNIEAR